MAAETVLVTGAFGQVGVRCAERLLERGYTVVATDLRNQKSARALSRLLRSGHPGALVAEYADLRDEAAVRKLVEEHRPDVIVHFAAVLAPASYRDPRLARTVNVAGTRALVNAATALAKPPRFVLASSASVYGSRNPHRFPELITAETAVHPIDQYGEDKAQAEAIVRDSGLRYSVLRLGGVISPDATAEMNRDVMFLARVSPRDNRVHVVDARDAALAFANAAERGGTIDGRVLLIGGNESCMLLQREVEDDLMEAMGIGRLGPTVGLLGDPDDDRGWSFTGWFDTAESQKLLEFQQHDWRDTVAWMAESRGSGAAVLRALGPILRPIARLTLCVQHRLDRRGPYADPWRLIEKRYGRDVLAPTDF